MPTRSGSSYLVGESSESFESDAGNRNPPNMDPESLERALNQITQNMATLTQSQATFRQDLRKDLADFRQEIETRLQDVEQRHACARTRAEVKLQKSLDAIKTYIKSLPPSTPLVEPARVPPPAVSESLVPFPSPVAASEDPPPPSSVPPPAVPASLVLLPLIEAKSEETPLPSYVTPPAVFAPLVTSPPPERYLLLGVYTERGTLEYSLAIFVVVGLTRSPPEPEFQTDFTYWRVPSGVHLRWRRLVWDPGADRRIVRHQLLGLHHQMLILKIHRGESTDPGLLRCGFLFTELEVEFFQSPGV